MTGVTSSVAMRLTLPGGLCCLHRWETDLVKRDGRNVEGGCAAVLMLSKDVVNVAVRFAGNPLMSKG